MTVPLPTMAQVRQASATTAVGKHASGALYVHRTALPKLPAEFQDVYVVARGIMENHGVSSSDADIIKFHLTKSAVSFVYLQDDFDFVAHPAEALVIFVDLKDPTISPVSRSFMKSRNPPILHRKEQLVLLDYPRRDEFEALTQQEIKARLLDWPPGYRCQWERLLRDRGFRVEGNHLVKA